MRRLKKVLQTLFVFFWLKIFELGTKKFIALKVETQEGGWVGKYGRDKKTSSVENYLYVREILKSTPEVGVSKNLELNTFSHGR